MTPNDPIHETPRNTLKLIPIKVDVVHHHEAAEGAGGKHPGAFHWMTHRGPTMQMSPGSNRTSRPAIYGRRRATVPFLLLFRFC